MIGTLFGYVLVGGNICGISIGSVVILWVGRYRVSGIIGGW